MSLSSLTLWWPVNYRKLLIVNMASLFQRADITDSNYSPINSILTWIMLIAIFLAVLVKIVMKIVYSHSFGTDDAILGVALVRK